MICGDSRAGNPFISLFLSLPPFPEVTEGDEVECRPRDHRPLPPRDEHM